MIFKASSVRCFVCFETILHLFQVLENLTAREEIVMSRDKYLMIQITQNRFTEKTSFHISAFSTALLAGCTSKRDNFMCVLLYYIIVVVSLWMATQAACVTESLFIL